MLGMPKEFKLNCTTGMSQHMSPYHDHFEDYVLITPKPIMAADKWYFQAIGRGNLWIKIPNSSNSTTVLLKDILHCPDMELTLVLIGKITAARYKVIFRGLTCRIYNPKDKVIGQINTKNGLYCIGHEVIVNTTMAGEVLEVVSIKELHCWMGHIAPESIKKMMSHGAIDRIMIDSASNIQHCNLCKYAKATQKPIQKSWEMPQASHFSDEIHLDVWGPSPVQTPGHKEYYGSFTDDHTRWTHLQLLATNDGIFEAYRNFEAWAKLHFKIPTFKILWSN